MSSEREHDLLIEVARAYNTLDYRAIERISADNIKYTSQNVLSTLEGRQVVAGYLKEKFETIKHSNSPVFAELAHMKSQEAWNIQIPDLHEGDSCILLSQGEKHNKGAIILININSLNELDQINICTVVPHWSTAKGTGVYPS